MLLRVRYMKLRFSTVVTVVGASVVFIVLYVVILSKYTPERDFKETAANRKPKFNPISVIHLDMKGSPPRVTYLKELFPMLKAVGADAVLMEWEDMFPYEGLLTNLSAHNAYTRDQVSDILTWARISQLEVIPLIQTFGHLEFALKLPEFQYLREAPPYPQEICPSNVEAISLIYDMIRQVMSLHGNATKYLHIGCDEVYHLAMCDWCMNRKLTGREIFADHVMRIAKRVHSKYPGVTPLIWDDMLRQWPVFDLEASGLGALVEPVVWVYTDQIVQLVPNSVWSSYSRTFPAIWVASAFKGASGAQAVVPRLGTHAQNQLAWLRFLSRISAIKSVRGIMLTGWSRYDHFSVLCELLPAALPSLVLSLLLVKHAKEPYDINNINRVMDLWYKYLSCPSTVPETSIISLASDPFQWQLAECTFPGQEVYILSGAYTSLKSRIDGLHEEATVEQGWLTSYNIKYNFSSPHRIGDTILSAQHLMEELQELHNSTVAILNRYFDSYTADEWIEQYIQPLADKLIYLQETAEALTKKHTWPRRPIT